MPRRRRRHQAGKLDMPSYRPYEPRTGTRGDDAMRWLYLAIVCVLAAATLVFALQNLEIVSLDFVWFSVRTPLAFLVAAAYVVGMVTGGSSWGLIRRSVRGARQNA
jgi:lipopolysaccharide assembly protein A